MMFDSLLKNLGEVKATAGQLLVKCPAHDDEKPSLSISIKNGKTLLHCHAGCSVEAVLAAVSMSVKDLFPREVDKPAKKKIVAAYQYRDELGELLFESVRFEPKGFSYRSPLDGGYRWSIAGVRLVPYRLPELLAADRDFPVFIVEGEKDVDNLRAIGVSATCNPMGALKWKDDYAEHLRGFDCVILPDNDDAGRRHAREVAASLLGEAAQVSILEIPGLPEKGDVSDWLATGGTCEDLFALLTGAEIVTGNGIESSAVRPDELPERFYLTETGIYHRGEKDVFVCTPLRVAAYTCDKENGNWGRLVEFPDKTGIEHSLIIPMSALSGDAAEVRRTLMDAGLMISPVARGRQLFLE